MSEKLSIINKYKEISPLITINRIKKFFNDRNYNIKVINLQQRIINVWTCHIQLFSNDKQILFSNGKGVTKEYALASGYAELYERFCAWYDVNHKSIQKRVQFYKNKQYFPNQSVKIKTVEESLINCPTIKTFFDINGRDWYSLITKLYNNQVPNICFQNLENTQKIYLPIDFILLTQGSNGLATGNTLEEALVQGISELCERYVVTQCFYIENQLYYQLDLNTLILPEYLQTIILELQKIFYVFIYDLSYIYNLPVICVKLIDKKTNKEFLSFGSFPVFEIALERCFTEILQVNAKNINELIQNKQKMLDYNFSELFIKNPILLRNIGELNMYPSFDNYQIKNSYNTEIFCDKNLKNKDFYQYYKNLLVSQNMDLVYTDLSQDKNIKSVCIFILNKFSYDLFFIEYFKNYPIDWKLFENKEIYNLKLLSVEERYLELLLGEKSNDI